MTESMTGRWIYRGEMFSGLDERYFASTNESAKTVTAPRTPAIAVAAESEPMPGTW